MSTIYYKATQPDGTDFYSGRVDYAAHLASGEWLPELPELPISFGEGRRLCTSSAYHAADVPGETLIGGEWPCRLFEVQGDPFESDRHKFGFATLKVVREIEPWQALGPNGQQVAKVVKECRSLSAERVVAWTNRAPARRPPAGVEESVEAALSEAGVVAASDAAMTAIEKVLRVHQGSAGAAALAAWDLASALVARNSITAEAFDFLTAPWRELRGEL